MRILAVTVPASISFVLLAGCGGQQDSGEAGDSNTPVLNSIAEEGAVSESGQVGPRQEEPLPGDAATDPQTPAAAGGNAPPTSTNTAKDGSDEEHSQAMALYEQARSLMEQGKREEAYATAQQAMQQFIAKKNDLAWMMLETIELKDSVITVHFNMGPDERSPPPDGISRPLSFRIMPKGDPGAMQVIDFEVGRFEGKPLTAAIGSTTDAGHANFGILPVDASYQTIRDAVMQHVSGDADAGRE